MIGSLPNMLDGFSNLSEGGLGKKIEGVLTWNDYTGIISFGLDCLLFFPLIISTSTCGHIDTHLHTDSYMQSCACNAHVFTDNLVELLQ